MKNNTRKIVVLDRLNSTSIEQAIFILRDDSCPPPADAISEAQRIVDSYIKTMSNSSSVKEKAKMSPKFLLGITLYTISTVFLTAYLINFIG